MESHTFVERNGLVFDLAHDTSFRAYDVWVQYPDLTRLYVGTARRLFGALRIVVLAAMQ